jgi:hypothetical protein
MRRGQRGGFRLGGDEGEGGKKELHHGQDGGRQLQEDDEDGEDVPQRTGRENGGGHGEHVGHVDGRGLCAIGSSSTREGAGGRVEGVCVVLAAGLEAVERRVGPRARAVLGGAGRRSRGRRAGHDRGLFRRRGGGGRRRHRGVYVARGRRRRRLGLPIGVAVEVWVAALPGNALSDGRGEAILVVSGRAVRLAPLPLRYHVRGRRRAESADTAGRLGCNTGRARLGDGGAGCGGCRGSRESVRGRQPACPKLAVPVTLCTALRAPPRPQTIVSKCLQAVRRPRCPWFAVQSHGRKFRLWRARARSLPDAPIEPAVRALPVRPARVLRPFRPLPARTRQATGDNTMRDGPGTTHRASYSPAAAASPAAQHAVAYLSHVPSITAPKMGPAQDQRARARMGTLLPPP